MDYTEFNIFKQFNDKLGYFVFGQTNVLKEREKIINFLGCRPENLISMEQVHSDNIIYIDCPQKREIYGFDSMITDKKGFFLMTKIADCQAVCIFDPNKNVIANVHNGWRGSAKNIVGKTIQKMGNQFKCDAKDLYIAVSPSLGPCHSEFSDPYKELPEDLHMYINKNNHVDFWKATKNQLINEGVPEENIEMTDICTVCNKDKYFSYRAGDKGRFGVVIGMY